MNKLPVAIFLQRYWGEKMTFVERQLSGLSKYYDLYIFAPVNEDNTQRPYPVFAKEKNILEKVQSGFTKKFLTRFTNTSFSQKAYWGKIISEKNIKLIHAHFGPAGIQALPLARKFDASLLVSFHGYDASKLLEDKVYVFNIREVFNYRRAHLICVSEYMKSKLLSIGAKEDSITVNYYGIPVDQFRYVKRISPAEKYRSNGLVKFLQIANFQEKKGHIYTVMAFKKLLDYYPNCTLTLAGSGPLKDEIVTLCKRECIEEKVTFTGGVSVNEVFPLLENHDIFVHHSITGASGDQEGIPNSIIEAMATGMPAISTYHSGIPELIEDGTSGFLVKEKDVDSYAQKMIASLGDEGNMGLKAHETVYEKFNLAKQIEKLSAMYSSLIKQV